MKLREAQVCVYVFGYGVQNITTQTKNDAVVLKKYDPDDVIESGLPWWSDFAEISQLPEEEGLYILILSVEETRSGGWTEPEESDFRIDIESYIKLDVEIKFQTKEEREKAAGQLTLLPEDGEIS